MSDQHKRYSVTPPEGQTRICIDPWSKVFVRATGEVCICCNSDPVGSLKENTLEQILNGPEVIEYRAGLLNGQLKHICSVCPDRASGEVADLKERVKKFLDTGEVEI